MSAAHKNIYNTRVWQLSPSSGSKSNIRFGPSLANKMKLSWLDPSERCLVKWKELSTMFSRGIFRKNTPVSGKFCEVCSLSLRQMILFVLWGLWAVLARCLRWVYSFRASVREKKTENKVEKFGINLHFKRQIIINSCKEKDTFQAEFHAGISVVWR